MLYKITSRQPSRADWAGAIGAVAAVWSELLWLLWSVALCQLLLMLHSNSSTTESPLLFSSPSSESAFAHVLCNLSWQYYDLGQIRRSIMINPKVQDHSAMACGIVELTGVSEYFLLLFTKVNTKGCLKFVLCEKTSFYVPAFVFYNQYNLLFNKTWTKFKHFWMRECS